MTVFVVAGLVFDLSPCGGKLLLSIVDSEGGEDAAFVERYVTPDELRVIARELKEIASELEDK